MARDSVMADGSPASAHEGDTFDISDDTLANHPVISDAIQTVPQENAPGGGKKRRRGSRSQSDQREAPGVGQAVDNAGTADTDADAPTSKETEQPAIIFLPDLQQPSAAPEAVELLELADTGETEAPVAASSKQSPSVEPVELAEGDDSVVPTEDLPEAAGEQAPSSERGKQGEQDEQSGSAQRQSDLAVTETNIAVVEPDLPATVSESTVVKVSQTPRGLQQWRECLLAANLKDTLRYTDPRHVIDVTHAHPSGIAALLAGRSTKLSSLIRQPSAHAHTRNRIRSLAATISQLRDEHGIRSGFLGVGWVTWRRPILAAADNDDERSDVHCDNGDPQAPASELISAPLMLRGTQLTPIGAGHEDYEISLDDVTMLNPQLVSMLQAEHEISLDSASLTRLAFGAEGFDPAPVLTHVGQKCARVDGFTISTALVLGSFSSGSQALLDDFDASGIAIQAHPLMAAASQSREPLSAPEVVGNDLHQPDASNIVTETGDLDIEAACLVEVDEAQQQAVEHFRHRRNVAIQGPPGTGLTHTLAAIALDAATSGRRCVVFTPHRGSAESMRRIIAQAGFDDLVLDLHDGVGQRSKICQSLAPQLRLAIAAAVQDSGSSGDSLHKTLEKSRRSFAQAAKHYRSVLTELEQAQAAIHEQHDPWGVSAYQAMSKLAELTALPQPPVSRVRLNPRTCQELDAAQRDQVRSQLRELAQLGGFSVTRLDTRWLDARVSTDEEAQRALDAAKRAHAALPTAQTEMDRVCHEAGLSGADTIAQWRPRLDLLIGVRQTLDICLPAVFQCDLTELIEATGPNVGESWWERRSLRKRARALVRPGVHVRDLHAVLQAAADQGRQWYRLRNDDGAPRVPTGLAHASSSLNELEEALAQLSSVLVGTATPDLITLALETARIRLADLATDETGIRSQPQRTVLLTRLRSAGFSELLAELRHRRAEAEDIDAEVDLVWWTSVLDAIIRNNPILSEHQPQDATGQAQRLETAQRNAMKAKSALLSVERAIRARDVVRSHRSQAAWLRAEVNDSQRSQWPADLFAKAPDVVAALRPIWVMSPHAMAHCLPAARPGEPNIDVLVIDDAHQVSVAHAASAIARANQVVLAGDPQRLPPASGGPSIFDVARSEQQREENIAGNSVIELVSLYREHRARDARLRQVLQRHYPQPWQAFPGASSSSPLRLHYVVEAVAPAAVSTDAEVAATIRLIADHAVRRPQQSLAVITLGMRHAQNLESALRQVSSARPELAQWLIDHWGSDVAKESFVIRPIHRLTGLERDHIIISLGIARTGAQQQFSVLDGAYGAACINTALSRSRLATTIVSSLSVADFEQITDMSVGARYWQQVVAAAAGAGADTATVTAPSTARGSVQKLASTASEKSLSAAGWDDVLAQDVRRRLQESGMTVVIPPAVPDWPLLAALADPWGQPLVVVDFEGPAFDACSSASLKFSLRQRGCERAGWAYTRLCAMDVFSDPIEQVNRVQRLWEKTLAKSSTTAGSHPSLENISNWLAVQSDSDWPEGSSEQAQLGLAGPVERQLADTLPAVVRPPFPNIALGRPASTYASADFVAVGSWVLTDGKVRDPQELADDIRESLRLIAPDEMSEGTILAAAQRIVDLRQRH